MFALLGARLSRRNYRQWAGLSPLEARSDAEPVATWTARRCWQLEWPEDRASSGASRVAAQAWSPISRPAPLIWRPEEMDSHRSPVGPCWSSKVGRRRRVRASRAAAANDSQFLRCRCCPQLSLPVDWSPMSGVLMQERSKRPQSTCEARLCVCALMFYGWQPLQVVAGVCCFGSALQLEVNK